LAAISLARVTQLRFPAQSLEERRSPTRPVGEILRQPPVVVAILASAVGYGVMNLLMAATPLAMDLCCHHSFADTTFVLQWHTIGMVAPAFFTRALLKRAGVLNVLLAGAALLFTCVAIAMHGLSVMHFWWALTLLGIGWNFLYIGGTALLSEAHDPAEKAAVQGVNDFIVYVVMATTGLMSGVVITGSKGWALLTELSLPFVAVTTLATAVLWLRDRRAATAASA